jgi:hypothetical protein
MNNKYVEKLERKKKSNNSTNRMLFYLFIFFKFACVDMSKRVI